MKSVCIQIGHWQCENLTAKNLRSWRSAELLSKSTGASGERDYHWNKVMPLLKEMLIKKGIQVYIAGSTWDEIYSNNNFDLWVSLHYDGGGSENRCMISAPTRSASPAFLNDKAQRESERFCAIWRSVYPEITETINRDERITEGMIWYYGFDFVPLDTPAVIIEHFNHTSTKGQELKQNPKLVAEADFKAILQFLDIPEEEPSKKYEVHFKGQNIAEYDFDITKKLVEVEKNLTDKTNDYIKLSKDFEAYKLKKAKEISNLNLSHINYKTKMEKTINTKNKEISDFNVDILGYKQTIKELKKRPSNLDLYSAWDFIGLGITKLFKREKANVKEVSKNE